MFTETGRLSRNAEFLGSEGHRLARFTVASFDQVQPGYNQDPSFIQYKMSMRSQAQEDAMKKLLTKGQVVALTGDFRQNNYTDKDGNDHYGVDFQVNNLQVTFTNGGRNSTDDNSQNADTKDTPADTKDEPAKEEATSAEPADSTIPEPAQL